MPNPNLPQNPFEEIPDPKKEEEQIKDIADRTVKLLDKRYPSKNNPILRGVHPKSHGCVRAVFQVNADIGKEYQVGLFAKPGKRYDAWIRYSNADGPDRVMKFSAQPSAGVKLQTVLENPPPSDNYLREALIKTMSGDQEISFDFMVQVRGKEDALNKEDPLNIENASSPEWDKSKFPFVKVAKIAIPAPQKDIDSESGVKHCENLVFTPWHSLAEHQPLGSINRLRKAVYIASETHRGAKAVPPPDATKHPDEKKQPPNR